MSFVKALRLSLGVKNLLYSILWILVPLVNVVSVFFYCGFLVRLVQQCKRREYRIEYKEYGLLFVQGLFACFIMMAYLVPAIVVGAFFPVVGVVLAGLSVVAAAAGVARFAVSESFAEAFGPGTVRLLLRARFWMAFAVWALVSGVMGAVALAIMVVSASTLAIPVVVLSVWIVLSGLVGAALLGHAQN